MTVILANGNIGLGLGGVKPVNGFSLLLGYWISNGNTDVNKQ